jgi:type II secretory pathway pseudopilin PulG
MKPRARRGERGMTLIETLVAFLILFFVLISVLQIYAMAYAVNMGSSARTDLTYRAQRVAEVIRTIYAFRTAEPTTYATLVSSSGVNLAAQANTGPVTLPPTGKEAFWGSAWANAIEADAPYEITYEVTSVSGGAPFTVNVVAQGKTTGKRYMGIIGSGKAVRYAATIQ